MHTRCNKQQQIGFTVGTSQTRKSSSTTVSSADAVHKYLHVWQAFRQC